MHRSPAMTFHKQGLHLADGLFSTAEAVEGAPELLWTPLVCAGAHGRIHITEVEDRGSAAEGSANPLERLKQGEPVQAVVLGLVATQQVRVWPIAY